MKLLKKLSSQPSTRPTLPSTSPNPKMVQISCAPPRIRFKMAHRQLSRKSWRKKYIPPQRALRETVPPRSGNGVWSHVKIATKQRRTRSLNDIYDDPRSAARMNDSDVEAARAILGLCEKYGEGQWAKMLAEGQKAGGLREELTRVHLKDKCRNIKTKSATKAKSSSESNMIPCAPCNIELEAGEEDKTKNLKKRPKSGICEHGRTRYTCKECGGGGICQHGRIRAACKECGGCLICEHGRQRYLCKECGGKGICKHGLQRHHCKECKVKKVVEKAPGVCVLIEVVPALEILKMYDE